MKDIKAAMKKLNIQIHFKKFGAALVLLLSILISSCETKESPDHERQQMVENFRSAAECLEAGLPIVKCRQRVSNACEKLGLLK